MSQKRNFPDLIQAYLDYSSGHEGTPRCHLWSIISVIAASLERKVWMDRGYYTLFPNLYTFIIGKSGLIKKSTTTGIAIDLYRSLPDVRMMSERLTAASLINQLQLSGKTYSIGDKEFRQSSVFAYASELSVFMAEVSGSIVDLLTTFYDCSPHDCSKPWVYETKTSGIQKIYGPCLNILGASTKAWLKKCIPASEMEGGFSSRIIFVVENSAPKKFVAWPEMRPELHEMKEKLIDDLCLIHSMKGVMVPTQKARELFEKWYQHHMTLVVPDCHDPRMSGYLGRKGDLMLKLAMVRSASSDRGDYKITEGDLLWAGQELEAIEADMRIAFEGVGGSKETELTFEIRQYVRGRGSPVEKAEIKRAFAKDAPGYEVERALQDLVEMQEIDMFLSTEEQSAGRHFYAPHGFKVT